MSCGSPALPMGVLPRARPATGHGWSQQPRWRCLASGTAWGRQRLRGAARTGPSPLPSAGVGNGGWEGQVLVVSFVSYLATLFQLAIKAITFPQVQSVLPMMVVGKGSPCLNPQVCPTLFSPHHTEEGQ